MFIAMNRFRVAKGSEAAFEQVWLSRDSHLDKVPGFVEFHLLKGLRCFSQVSGKPFHWPNLRPSRRIVGQGTTSRCIGSPAVAGVLRSPGGGTRQGSSGVPYGGWRA